PNERNDRWRSARPYVQFDSLITDFAADCPATPQRTRGSRLPPDAAEDQAGRLPGRGDQPGIHKLEAVGEAADLVPAARHHRRGGRLPKGVAFGAWLTTAEHRARHPSAAS